MSAVVMSEVLWRRAAAVVHGVVAPCRRGRLGLLVLLATGGLVGCGALDVSDPTAVEESDLDDPAGAELLRGAALMRLAEAVSEGAYFSGLLADEFLYDVPVWAAPGTQMEELLDRRESALFEALGADGGYQRWKRARHAADMALPKVRAYPAAGAGLTTVGEMLAVRGYATLRLAEDFCPGFPLHKVVDFAPVYTEPLSTEAVFTQALTDFDSAVTLAADSARILHFAQVGWGRTLLGLGRFAEARAAVAEVPTAYVAHAEYSTAFGLPANSYLPFRTAGLRRSVANTEGGTGLDFVAAEDPRLPPDTLGTAVDGVTGIYGIAKYPDQAAPIVIASGIEARLIEAEAALNADPESGEWLAILNTLRTEVVGGVAGLAPLADPGTPEARVDLLFRERAFWLFATGHRLADLRRLVQHYGRTPESVFPTGAFRLGGTYGTATSIPFPAEQEQAFNPAVTGCASR